MTNQFKIFFTLLFFPFILQGCKRDFQFWTSQRLIAPIHTHIEGEAKVGSRWKNDASTPFFHYAQVGLIWKGCKTWLIEPIYREGFHRKGNGWKPEQTPMLDIYKYAHHDLFTLSHRFRFQYTSNRREWFFRNRFKISYAINNWRLYIADEIFLLRGKELSQNRFFIGLKTPHFYCIRAHMAYFLRHDWESPRWLPRDVFFAGLEGNF